MIYIFEMSTHKMDVESFAYLVINISDIHDEVNIIAKVICENSSQDILGDIVPIWSDQDEFSYRRDQESHLACPICDAS
jgi:hypothetical protein